MEEIRRSTDAATQFISGPLTPEVGGPLLFCLRNAAFLRFTTSIRGFRTMGRNHTLSRCE
jgi:hypothetical protein